MTSLRSGSRSRSTSPSHSVQTSVIQSTKNFSQQLHHNGASATVSSSTSDVQIESDGDVEMNGSTPQNGSHTTDPSEVKDESLHEMGIYSF